MLVLDAFTLETCVMVWLVAVSWPRDTWNRSDIPQRHETNSGVEYRAVCTFHGCRVYSPRVDAIIRHPSE